MKSLQLYLQCLGVAFAVVVTQTAFAKGDLLDSKMAMNGVEVLLFGTQESPNNIVIQKILPIIEFEGLTQRGGAQVVQGYDQTFGKNYYVNYAKGYLARTQKAFTEEELQIAADTSAEFLEDFPRLKTFLSGMAEASGLTEQEVQLAFWAEDALFARSMKDMGEQLFADKPIRLHGADAISKGCTVVGFTNGVLGQNMDLDIDMTGETVAWKSPEVIINAPSPFHPVMALSRNMASNTNTIDIFSTVALENGVSLGLMYLAVVTHAESVDEAQSLMGKYRLAGSPATTLADKDGGLKTFEWHANGFKVFEAENGFIAHTNHPRGQAKNLADALFGGSIYDFNATVKETVARYKQAANFAQFDQERSAGSIRTLLAQRPILMAPTAENYFITATSNVSDINAGRMYIAPYRPDLVDYTIVQFDE